MKPRVVLVLLVLALAGALVVLLGERGRESAMGEDPPVRVEEGTAPAADLVPAVAPAQEGPGRREVADETDELPPSFLPLDGSNGATLVVRTVAEEDGAPLEGFHVTLVSLEPWMHSGGKLVERVFAVAGESAVTGPEGRVELDLPPGKRWRVRAWRAGANYETDGVDVDALDRGERREVVLSYPTVDDLLVYLRVVAEDDGQPVVGAAVRVGGAWQRSRDPTTQGGRIKMMAQVEVETGADGRVDFTARSWEGAWVEVCAARFAPAYFILPGGHRAPHKELVVELARGATLRGLVVDAGGDPLSEIDAYLNPSSGNLPGAPIPELAYHSMVAMTGADGRFELLDLPPNMALDLTLWRSLKRIRNEPGAFVFAPGETREGTWRIGAGARLTGRLVSFASGEPVAGHRVWLVRGDRAHYFGPTDKPSAKMRTADDGSFAFEDVAVGTWRVGPWPLAGTGSRSRPGGGAVSSAFSPVSAWAPLAAVVEIEPGVHARDVLIRAHEDLYIHGRIIDTEGSPYAGAAYVFARSFEHGTRNARAAAGNFTIGPLAPGRHQVGAQLFAGGYAPPEPIDADAGAHDVVLRLRAAGKLRGSVEDAATGEPIQADVRAFSSGTLEIKHARSDSGTPGGFVIEGLLPRTYDVTAITPDGRVGISTGHEIIAGGVVEGVVVVVRPGATLEVRAPPGDPRWRFDVYRDDRWVNGAPAGADPNTVHVPPGDLLLRWTHPTSTAVVEKTVTIAPGETLAVVFPR